MGLEDNINDFEREILNVEDALSNDDLNQLKEAVKYLLKEWKTYLSKDLKDYDEYYIKELERDIDKYEGIVEERNDEIADQLYEIDKLEKKIGKLKEVLEDKE